jgi:hypothetical protein
VWRLAPLRRPGAHGLLHLGEHHLTPQRLNLTCFFPNAVWPARRRVLLALVYIGSRIRVGLLLRSNATE